MQTFVTFETHSSYFEVNLMKILRQVVFLYLWCSDVELYAFLGGHLRH